jgi:hypothetical protein
MPAEALGVTAPRPGRAREEARQKHGRAWGRGPHAPEEGGAGSVQRP